MKNVKLENGIEVIVVNERADFYDKDGNWLFKADTMDEKIFPMLISVYKEGYQQGTDNGENKLRANFQKLLGIN